MRSWDGNLLAVTPSPALLFGLILLAAIVGGYAARTLHVPRVVGYLVVGIALRFGLYEVLGAGADEEAARKLAAAEEPLKAIKDLALGIIVFLLGGVFERTRVRATIRHAGRISLLDVSCSLLFVFVACLLALWVTPTQATAAECVVIAILLGIAAVEIAPAATLFVLQEYEAKGPITDTVLCVAGLGSVACILLFYPIFLILASTGLIDVGQALGQNIWLALAITVLGSIAMGVVLGALISIIHAELPLPETMLVFFAMFVLLGAGEKWLLENTGVAYNFLLTALVTGIIFANVAIDSDRLTMSLRTVGGPLFAGFFVLAGYDVHLDEMWHMGWLGVAFVVGRFSAKLVASIYGVRWAKAPPRVGHRLGTALLCQASIAIGLASYVQQQWDSDVARQFAAVLLGGVVLFELVGPLLLKRVVLMGGEVKAITLLSRTGHGAPFASVLRITLESLLRLVRPRTSTAKRDEEDGPLQARHVMRTNVQFIPASASFDELLAFIERSTYDHFPVIRENGELAGVIHFMDVRDVIYDPSLSSLVAAYDLADPETPSVSMDTPLDDVLEIFTAHNVGTLPVTEAGESLRVVGIIEQRDVLKALHQTMKPS
jgi:Kef-type K+ transport system membrane component KefB/CBS domain-containing protein